MRRKKLLTVGLSALLMMSVTGTVLAGVTFNDGEEHVIGSVSDSGSSSETGNPNNAALTVNGEDTKVTVEGNVTASGSSTAGVFTTSGSTTVTGNVKSGGAGIVAVSEVGGSDVFAPEVTVEGKVTAAGTGITAWGESTVTVGSLESRDKALSVSTAEVTVKGDVKAGNGADGESISMNGDSTVLIGGELSFRGGTEEARLGLNDSSENSELAIGGVLQNEDTKVILSVEVDSDGNLKDFPEIVLGEVADFSNLEVERRSFDEEDQTELTNAQKEQVLSSIKYVVSSNKDSLSGKGSLQITKVDGNALDRDRADQYDVAKAYETITVHVNVANGYKLTGLNAGKASVIRNTDGSYSVTVPQGGGVNIEALLQEIEYQERSWRESRSHTASSWKHNTDGSWHYIKQDGTRAVSEWLYLEWNGKSGWYYFDTNGQMKRGWFQDKDGSLYYLNPVTDGSGGMMQTGWLEIDNEWYYFEPQGTDGYPQGALRTDKAFYE